MHGGKGPSANPPASPSATRFEAEPSNTLGIFPAASSPQPVPESLQASQLPSPSPAGHRIQPEKQLPPWPPAVATADRHDQPQARPRLSRSDTKSKKRLSRAQPAYSSTMSSSSSKKARTGVSPSRRFEIPADASGPLTASSAKAIREGIQSPLFFSNSPGRHFSRLSTDSTDQPISPARIRDNGSESVTTVKMPSANVRTISPTVSTSTPGSLTSSAEMSISTLASPDSRPLPVNLQVLRSMSIVELLDGDDRPTFMVDVAACGTPNRLSLPILYSNPSLRSFQEIHHIFMIENENSPNAEAFEKFRSWVMATIPDYSRPELFAPSMEYEKIVWTKSTVRQRFRFISGNINTSTRRRSSGLSQSHTIPDEPNSVCVSMPNTPPVPDAVDPPDYFGEAPETLLAGDAMDISSSETLPVRPQLADDGLRHHPDAFTNEVLQSQPVKTSFDWTRIPLTDDLPEHIKFARNMDWTATDVGPMDEWSYELRVTSNLIMGSPHPACLYWGPELTCIYNAAYIELAGQKHPKLMGKRYKDGWPEIYDSIIPIFNSALLNGQATMKHDNRLFLDRNGFLEETVFSWSIVPIIGRDGEVVGLYNAAFENTLRSVTERRMRTLREIGQLISAATTVQHFWQLVSKALEYNEVDIPFSLIYSAKGDTDSDAASSTQSSAVGFSLPVTLVHSAGVPAGHHAAPATLDLRQSGDAFAPYMLNSIAQGAAEIVLCEADGTLPHDLLDGIEFRGYGDRCTTVIVTPIIPTTGDGVTCFMVMGANPRRPYDDDYKLFTQLLSRQLATSMASVMLFEEEIRRGQRAAREAALDRQELSMQLLLRTQEATESEFKFSRMAQFAPVGMFIADSKGTICYCNEMWEQISGNSRSEETVKAWMNSVRDEDRPELEASWLTLLEEKTTISLEFRFKGNKHTDGKSIDTWVLMSAYPEKNIDGSLKSIFGCITDISSQKWAQKVQNERREEAVELKRQQENFIDITSHEMRNPLSAVLQCADQIVQNIATFSAYTAQKEVELLLESCADAANTINLCASHQKRIVDDILTLSKLDSNLLTVTPADDKPVAIVQRTLQMFKSELLTHNIDLEFKVDDSFDRHGVKYARLDPSRLSQILINLMTNAIKFTQGHETRNITVSLGMSRDVSEVAAQGITFLPRQGGQRMPEVNIHTDEWGTGDIINIHCSVEDTGRGLSEEELKILFQRFQQATPRTHVQYGGSGLGLFISRILAEMQGGQIGVTSNRTLGSKFNFYIRCRKSERGPDSQPVSAFTQQHKCPQQVSPAHQAEITPRQRSPAEAASSKLYDVLIVEDNLVNQRVLQRQLRNCGNNIFVANHGEEALQTLERSRFWAGRDGQGVDISVILMDLEMPVMDGMTCTKRIRQLERDGTIVEHIPIIAVTAYARPEQIAAAKEAGIVSCFPPLATT